MKTKPLHTDSTLFIFIPSRDMLFINKLKGIIMKIWEDAYRNTTKIPFGIGEKIVCRKCNEITDTEATTQRQLLGNCYQFIVKCKKCNDHFIDE